MTKRTREDGTSSAAVDDREVRFQPSTRDDAKEHAAATESKTIGELVDLADVRSLVVRDYWMGMHARAPFLLLWDFNATPDGMTGRATFSVRDAQPHEEERTLPRSTVAKFVKAISSALATDHPYEPHVDHTDDMPEIEIVIHARGGLCLLRTTSQGEHHSPWCAIIQGQCYTLPEDAVGRALNALRGPLGRERLQSLLDAADEPTQVEAHELESELVRALWMRGAVSKDEAIRICATHLRSLGWLQFQRLRSDGEIYKLVSDRLDIAVKNGLVDRPGRGYRRAVRRDASDYSIDDWRAILLASLDETPTDREVAMRSAAAWAKENLGLSFARLHANGEILSGLKSAINSGIRRGELRRCGANAIARASALADPEDSNAVHDNEENSDSALPNAIRVVSISMIDGDFEAYEMGTFYCIDGRVIVLKDTWLISELRSDGIETSDGRRLTFDDGDEFVDNVHRAWPTIQSRTVLVRVAEAAEADEIRARVASRGADAREKSRQYDHVTIPDLDVVLLQTASGRLALQDVVFNVFEAESERRREGTSWLAFHGSGMPHHMGKSEWIGLSKSVPLEVIDMIQAVLTSSSIGVEREMGRALHLDLNPFARLSDDGLEILVPAAVVGDPDDRRTIERAGVTVTARGYILGKSKAAAFGELFSNTDQ